jgi:hypothetical protein
MVASVTPSAPCDGILQARDVLVAIDDKPIDSAGMVTIDGENVTMNEIVERKFAGDKVKLRFLRNGEAKEAEITLKTIPAASMYAIQYEKQPRFIMFAGLVFQPLDTNLYASHKFNDIHLRRLYADYLPKGVFREHEDIVVLTRIESDPLTSQLNGFEGLAVDCINGTKVKSLRHAYELLHPDQPPEMFVIDFIGADRPIVLPAGAIKEATERVQAAYGISRLANLDD